ncbi:MAG TPA: NADPH-dependent FMN reductase [Kofleriaceae bacterium]|nr:NADPH-dependent FMN reductase [Kofleriaceae bacterium]
MPNIVAISGSTRRASFNTMLLRAAIERVPEGTTITVGSIRDIPLYDGDVEATSGIPPAVQALKDQIAGADGVLIVTPEYNNSIPGTLKNAIDWTSRPPADMARVWGGRPVGIMGATPGNGGTGLAQAAWLPVLRTLGTLPFYGARLQVSNAGSVFDAEGKLVDDKIRGLLDKYMTTFAQFVARHGPR